MANFSPRTEHLLRAFQKQFGIDLFIETGTHVGETTRWASGVFPQVITIEMDSKLYNIAKKENNNLPNVAFVQGKSQDELKNIKTEPNSYNIFYLDAHCGTKWRKDAGEKSKAKETPNCPVLEELEAISELKGEKIIFIDDARIFLQPDNKWHDIYTVLNKIKNINPEYYIAIYADEIIAVPFKIRDFLIDRTKDIDKSFNVKRT